MRSVEYDGKRLQTACRCRLKLPATYYMIQRQPPLPGQSLSGCGHDGASEDNREFRCFRPQLKPFVMCCGFPLVFLNLRSSLEHILVAKCTADHPQVMRMTRLSAKVRARILHDLGRFPQQHNETDSRGSGCKCECKRLFPPFLMFFAGRFVSSHTLPNMLFACWRCSKFPAGKFVQPRFPKSECDRPCGTIPCLRPFLATNRESLGVSDFRVSFSHPTDGFSSAMAISRVYSGGYHHEGLHIGFHVRLRHHLLRRARATHPKHSSEHRCLETP